MSHRKQQPPIIRVGSRVQAIYDHEPFATSYGPQYRAGEFATVIGIRDAGGIELQFDDGRVPTMITETLKRERRIAHLRSDFRLAEPVGSGK